MLAVWQVTAASLPPEALPLLAELRAVPGVRVATANGRLWVCWEPGHEELVRRVLSLPGVDLYTARDGHWYRLGSSLPAFQFPASANFRPLYQVLFPEPLRAMPPPDTPPEPLTLRVVPDARQRPTSAVECGLPELARWADRVPRARLADLEAAWWPDRKVPPLPRTRGRGVGGEGDRTLQQTSPPHPNPSPPSTGERGSVGRVLLLGTPPPPIAGGDRYWGERMLLPLGYRAEPDWPESLLREALRIDDDHLLIGTPARLEVVPRSVFRPLTRAGIRLACQEAGCPS